MAGLITDICSSLSECRAFIRNSQEAAIDQKRSLDDANSALESACILMIQLSNLTGGSLFKGQSKAHDWQDRIRTLLLEVQADVEAMRNVENADHSFAKRISARVESACGLMNIVTEMRKNRKAANARNPSAPAAARTGARKSETSAWPPAACHPPALEDRFGPVKVPGINCDYILASGRTSNDVWPNEWTIAKKVRCMKFLLARKQSYIEADNIDSWWLATERAYYFAFRDFPTQPLRRVACGGTDAGGSYNQNAIGWLAVFEKQIMKRLWGPPKRYTLLEDLYQEWGELECERMRYECGMAFDTDDEEMLIADDRRDMRKGIIPEAYDRLAGFDDEDDVEFFDYQGVGSELPVVATNDESPAQPSMTTARNDKRKRDLEDNTLENTSAARSKTPRTASMTNSAEDWSLFVQSVPAAPVDHASVQDGISDEQMSHFTEDEAKAKSIEARELQALGTRVQFLSDNGLIASHLLAEEPEIMAKITAIALKSLPALTYRPQKQIPDPLTRLRLSEPRAIAMYGARLQKFQEECQRVQRISARMQQMKKSGLLICDNWSRRLHEIEGNGVEKHLQLFQAQTSSPALIAAEAQVSRIVKYAALLESAAFSLECARDDDPSGLLSPQCSGSFEELPILTIDAGTIARKLLPTALQQNPEVWHVCKINKKQLLARLKGQITAVRYQADFLRSVATRLMVVKERGILLSYLFEPEDLVLFKRSMTDAHRVLPSSGRFQHPAAVEDIAKVQAIISADSESTRQLAMFEVQALLVLEKAKIAQKVLETLEFMRGRGGIFECIDARDEDDRTSLGSP